jgi:dolichyl-phosphate beta-glucosyltransferase
VGKGGAVKAGMSAARGRYLGYLDADLSLDPADVSRALARIETTGVDLVVGERVVDSSRQPRLRRFASGVFRRLAEGISGVSLADPQCAMKIFRADVAAELFGALTVNGFAFDVEVLARAVRKNYQVEEMKIRWQHQPGSKVNPVTDGFRMYTELLRIRRRMNSER